MGKMIKLLGSAFFVLGVISTALAVAPAPPGVPEIDPSFAPGAIALLVCGILMLVYKFGRK